MPYAAIGYRVEPGHEDEIAEIFESFQRVNTGVLRDEHGAEVGRLLGTAVFIQDDFMVRVVHYEGDLSSMGRHMATQKGVHLVEEKLQPFLKEQREIATPQAFGEFFRTAMMRRISQFSFEDHPVDAALTRGGRG
jgi:hypothetical protein